MVTKDASVVKADALVKGTAIPYLSLWAPFESTTTSPRRVEIEAALLELDQAIEAEDALAPRFVCKEEGRQLSDATCPTNMAGVERDQWRFGFVP